MVLFATITFIGIAGMFATALTQRGLSDVSSAWMDAARKNIAAKDGLIEALNRKADAFQREAEVATRLAEEREKTLAIYRKMLGTSQEKAL